MLPLALQLATYEAGKQVEEHGQRWEAYKAARSVADALGKPLLNVGCPRKYPFKYPCGDYCVDIDPERLALCQSAHPTLADVRDLSQFADDTFGAALVSHVLEHLPTVDDATKALAELSRVAGGRVWVVAPSRTSLLAWIHREHRLWIDELPDGSLKITQR